ncbi:MAG TPA: ABC transporter ATP-binding protein [Ruania sp.]|nr:ABC transporter ATP-binding protein [Ruania sp.]
MGDVELRAVTKSFPDGKGSVTQVLHGVDIRARSGEFVVLLGPSGCGKSTSLRILAGLERATSGEVLIDGKDVGDVPASRRGIAMVFQNYALYPHLTVMENIIFGLRVRRVPKAERRRLGEEAAEKVGLLPYLDRRPSQLSGGQRQRAALARALVSDAKVVLMDEPLSNLDAKLRHQMRVELRRLQRQLALTVIYVTHDQVEAMTMADHVVVMREGRIAQAAAPVDLYVDPADTGVAAFVGSPPMNLLPGRLQGGSLDLFGRVCPLGLADLDTEGDVVVGVRPETLTIGDEGPIVLAGTVRTSEILGAETLLTVEVSDQDVVARLPGVVRVPDGEEISLSAGVPALRLFDGDSGQALAATRSESLAPALNDSTTT